MGRGSDLDALLSPQPVAPGARGEASPPQQESDPNARSPFLHKLKLKGGPFDGEIAYSADRTSELWMWSQTNVTSEGRRFTRVLGAKKNPERDGQTVYVRTSKHHYDGAEVIPVYAPQNS